MTANNLFNIILKVLGIFFIKDILIALPSFFGIFISFFGHDVEGTIITSVLSLVSILIYCVIIYFLIFRTNLLIAKLKLTNDFLQEPLKLNIHRSTVLSLAIISTGLFVITQAIPNLVRELVEFINYTRAKNGILGSTEPYKVTWVIADITELILGILLISNQKTIVNFIELKRKK